MIYQADFDGFRVKVEMENGLIRKCQVSFIKSMVDRNLHSFPDVPGSLKKKIELYFQGEDSDLNLVSLDFSTSTPFQRDVYNTLRKVGFGKTITYKELAILSGHPGAQRTVGRTLSLNPFQLFVP